MGWKLRGYDDGLSVYMNNIVIEDKIGMIRSRYKESRRYDWVEINNRSGGENNLMEFLRRCCIKIGDKDVRDRYNGVYWYYVRWQKVGKDNTNYDPWGRRFKAYKDGEEVYGIGDIKYECKYHNKVSMYDMEYDMEYIWYNNCYKYHNEIVGVYVMVTSIEGEGVYCVDLC